jgi:predicted dehydrogenase
MSNSSKIGVAFIGAGYMATEHAKAFRDIPGVHLTGVFSRTRDRAQKLASDFAMPLVASSIRELFERTESQLVVIAVPELSVREVCEEAFQFPWKLLIEKPAGYDVGDAEKIVAAAKNNHRDAFVALNRRHHSSTHAVLNDLRTDDAPRLIHVYDQEDQIAARNAGQPELVVKNWMYANSIHVIDYFTLLGRGKIQKVETIVPWDPENPRFVAAKVSFDSGDVGLYEAVWNGPGPWAVTVTTQRKRWEMRPLEQAAFQPYGSRKLEPVPVHDWDRQFKPGLRKQAEEAIKAVNGSPYSLPTVNDALISMKLVQSIYHGNSPK